MDGGQRLADVDADERRLARAEASLLLQDLLERAALDQLHPEAGIAVGARRAVDGDDAAMAHARQQAALVDDHVGVIGLRRLGDQLERDFAIELRIPGAEDGAVGAAAERPRAASGAPRRVRAGQVGWSCSRLSSRCVRWSLAISDTTRSSRISGRSCGARPTRRPPSRRRHHRRWPGRDDRGEAPAQSTRERPLSQQTPHAAARCRATRKRNVVAGRTAPDAPGRMAQERAAAGAGRRFDDDPDEEGDAARGKSGTASGNDDGHCRRPGRPGPAPARRRDR